MVIPFRNHPLQKELTTTKALHRKHGPRRAKLIETRLTQLEAADTLEMVRYLPGPRCHELKGNRAGQLSVDLDHPYRLIFVPDHQPLVSRFPDLAPRLAGISYEDSRTQSRRHHPLRPPKKIAPSVVLGRLQHREKCVRPHLYNDLKQRLEIQWNGLKE